MDKVVFVVEGKNDAHALVRAGVQSVIVTTNGSHLSKKCISYIKKLSDDHEIIVLVDPDYPGQRIRSILEQHIPNARHIFIDQKLCRQGKKVGIEHVDVEKLKDALSDIKIYQKKYETLSYDQFITLGLTGQPNSANSRRCVCDYLNIGHCNAKTLFKRLNYLSFTQAEIAKILGESK